MSLKISSILHGNFMRKVINPQMQLGEVDISKIEVDLRSRDEVPKMLLGFQYIYTNLKIRDEVFKKLEKMIPEHIDSDNGRPGMELWRILVLGSLRLNCNWNFDKLEDEANNHNTIRQMLGVNDTLGMGNRKIFPINTLKQNISLFTHQVLEEINKIVVKYAQGEIEKKKDTPIKAHCDSFVVNTNVHYPTDVNLLNDAMRKTITITKRLCLEKGIEGWRQGKKLIRECKKQMHLIQNLKRGGGKDKAKKEKKIKDAHKDYINFAGKILLRVCDNLQVLRKLKLTKRQENKLILIDRYYNDAIRQIDQIRRRVLQGKAIPQSEKMYSIFERHTEWIVKGKAGVPQELGLKVCIIKDQFGLIMNHSVMEHLQDVDLTVPFTLETKKEFPKMVSCGYDKGFYSPDNYTALTKILKTVIMPKKGKLNSAEMERETSKEFIRERKKHSAVESSIAALENHGLDLCPDKGIHGFKRYVALAVLSRNIQILGNVIQQRELRKLQKNEEKGRNKPIAA